MPKPAKNPKLEKLPGKESIYLLMPWSCNHHPDYSEIVAHIPATGEWEVIAEIHDAAGIDAEHLAGFIARAANSYEKSRDLVAQMVDALDLCLACNGKLTWEAEHEAQVVLERAKQNNSP
ncbi:MAG: hypothetical protein SFW62_01065 [Alphaproteobacteria bacterium]|nr:hypothetical protein [Alphaproteobacteria bacterium]